MALSRRYVYTGLSALYLLALTILAAWALHRTQIHRLPIPTALGAFTLALPAITGLALESLTGTANTSRHPIKWSPTLGSPNTWSSYALTTLFILETVLASLTGTYITPISNLTCGLDTRWRSLYSSKNEEVIRRIQDAFNCCGLHSTRDMAYPFPSGRPGEGRGAEACEALYGRSRSCFESWRGEQRRVAGVMMGVVVGTVVWKVLVIYMQGRRSWTDDTGAAREDGNERRQLEYRDAEQPYSDQPDVEDVEEGEAPVLRVVPSLLRDNEQDRGRMEV